MIFSSTIFIIYFLPLFLGVYFLAKKKLHNAIVLVFSVFFYAWGAPSFVFILLGSTFINYLVVQKMNKSTDKKNKQIFLWASVIINLGLLAYFKYANVFIENTNGILTNIGVEAIVRGISYSDNTVVDAEIKLDYTMDFVPIVQPGLELGYRYQQIKLDAGSIGVDADFDTTFSGVYGGIMVRF